MGLFGLLKNTFSTGGIKVKLTVPTDFKWGDETIPVTVTLRGHKSEPRTIKSLGFTVEDVIEQNKNDDSRPTNGSRVRMVWEREGAISLPPGETITLEVPVVVSSEEEKEARKAFQESLQGTKAGKFLGAASRVGLSFGVGTDPSEIRSYLITVHAPVEGANDTASDSRRIRQGGAFHMGRVKYGL